METFWKRGICIFLKLVFWQQKADFLGCKELYTTKSLLNSSFNFYYVVNAFHFLEMYYKLNTTLDNGSLGSRIDEERSELR